MARTDLVCVPQRYSEAEQAMEQVLKLDTNCKEAVGDLLNCRVLQLMVGSPASKGVSCSACLLRMLMNRTSSELSSFKTNTTTLPVFTVDGNLIPFNQTFHGFLFVL